MQPCELINNARTLAIQRGLPVEQVSCPVTDVCEGSDCIYLRDDDEADDSIEVAKFYDRLEKHFQIKGTIYQNT
jgi:hypothetical protein